MELCDVALGEPLPAASADHAYGNAAPSTSTPQIYFIKSGGEPGVPIEPPGFPIGQLGVPADQSGFPMDQPGVPMEQCSIHIEEAGDVMGNVIGYIDL